MLAEMLCISHLAWHSVQPEKHKQVVNAMSAHDRSLVLEPSS